MQLPQWLARFSRDVTNPIQRLWAAWLPTKGILEHVGRRSGKHYRTPLTVFSTDDGVAILLTYGPDRDWLKNMTSAGQGRLQRYGRTFGVADPRVMPKSVAAVLSYAPATASRSCCRRHRYRLGAQHPGGGAVKLGGKTFRVADPRIVPTAEAAKTVKPPWGRTLKATGMQSTLLLTRAS